MDGDVKVRPAVPQDLAAIMDIIRQAQKALRERGVDQWQDGYPDEEAILKDIENGYCYVAVGRAKESAEENQEEILGAAAVIPDGEPDYDVIYGGRWLGEGPYLTVHRVAVGDRARRKGIASLLLAGAERIAEEMGLPSLRMDTHRDNLAMQACLSRNGLKQCGVIRLARDGAERLAYEKRLRE